MHAFGEYQIQRLSFDFKLHFRICLSDTNNIGAVLRVGREHTTVFYII